MPRYWLLKTEPSAYSFERLRDEGATPWTGVRNFQARNNMMEMRLGDLALFYHSSVAEPAAVGICKIVKTAYPDFTQFEQDGEYFDGRAKPDKAIWFMVDVAYVEAFENAVTLARMRHGAAATRTAAFRAARDAARVEDRFRARAETALDP
jgi:predicted RNA-binding protein with PUA-like domain